MSTSYVVRNSDGITVHEFYVAPEFYEAPDPERRAFNYADALAKLFPQMTFTVWRETQGSVSSDRVRTLLTHPSATSQPVT